MASVFVLATDHGTHSSDSWSDMVSQLIFPISEDIAQHKLLKAKSAQLNIATALSGHVQNVLDAERGHLANNADERFASDHDGHQYVDQAMALIHGVTDQTEWADQMHRNEAILRSELTKHFNSMQNVERLHHSDNHPSDAGDAYRAQFHGPKVY